jgi:L-lactate utilization protein LutC
MTATHDREAAFTSNIDRFTERAVTLGVTVQCVATSTDAANTIADLMRETGTAAALISTEITTAAPGIIAALDGIGCACTNDRPFGVSLARLAVAETASLLLAEASLEDRGIGLLVTHQLVICPTSLLKPTLDDAAPMLRELAAQPGGAYATLVTGPSRTADIERTLTVGVQGPAKLSVIFVDDLT